MVFEALLEVLQIETIVYMVLGVSWGIFLGALPGFGATLGMAILIPFTYGMSPIHALPMLAAIYTGAIYGGSITAILVGIPGTSASAATVMDGFAMTQKGEANRALTTSVFASAFGGIFGGCSLLLFAPSLARVALFFGPAEYFMLSLFGLTIISTVVGGSIVKGLIAGLFGIFLSQIGLDPITGEERFTFGNVYLLDGLPLISVILALFAFPRSLDMVRLAFTGDSNSTNEALVKRLGSSVRMKELWGMSRTILRSSVIGTLVGMVPGAGANIACWVGLSEARRHSKTPDRFGKGEPEGVAAAEAANNATEGGALIPMLTLSIPGSSAAAVLFGALMIHGLVPGPNLFSKHGAVTFTFIWSVIITNVIMLVLGYCGSRYFARVASVPLVALAPIMIAVTLVGAFATNQLIFDVWVTVILGSLCYFMTLADFPMPPILLGLILGPIAEGGLRRALMISHGDWSVFITRPICLFLLVLTGISLWVGIRMIRTQRKSEHF